MMASTRGLEFGKKVVISKIIHCLSGGDALDSFGQKRNVSNRLIAGILFIIAFRFFQDGQLLSSGP